MNNLNWKFMNTLYRIYKAALFDIAKNNLIAKIRANIQRQRTITSSNRG